MRPDCSLEFHYFIYVQYYTHDVFYDTLRHSLRAQEVGIRNVMIFMSSSCFIAVLIVDSREAGEPGTFRHTNYNFHIFYAPAIAFSFSFSSLHYVNY